MDIQGQPNNLVEFLQATKFNMFNRFRVDVDFKMLCYKGMYVSVNQHDVIFLGKYTEGTSVGLSSSIFSDKQEKEYFEYIKELDKNIDNYITSNVRTPEQNQKAKDEMVFCIGLKKQTVNEITSWVPYFIAYDPIRVNEWNEYNPVTNTAGKGLYKKGYTSIADNRKKQIEQARAQNNKQQNKKGNHWGNKGNGKPNNKNNSNKNNNVQKKQYPGSKVKVITPA